MAQEHRRLNEIAWFFGESPESIKKKISLLKLEVVVHAKKIRGTTTTTTSTSLVLTEELPSVEEALKDLVEAKTPIC